MTTTITTEQVKELRDKTSVSVMQCRKALEEAGGDMEKALIILRKKGSEMAEKKSDRTAVDGRVFIKSEGGKAVVVTLNCETDFVAQNQGFIDCGEAILAIAWNEGAEKAKEQAPSAINEAVLKTGENIQLGTIDEYSGETIGTYIHFNGKNAALVVLKGGNVDVAKDIAMHVSAMKPTYLQATDIKESDREAVIEVLKKEVDESGKPEDIKAKMMEGKISGYFKEQTLLDQPFFKNPEMTIGKVAENSGAEVVSFKLYTLG
ncbi:MAG TPA: translation elongation factor Ts [Candidatus Paceibacterota bacterium]|nr:translation elongation factor Ts [Candidatus Paceibacterota bacterium]